MGAQCNIILSFYTEAWNEIEPIKEYLKISRDETKIEAIGNRSWGPGGLQYYAISMKDWYEEECLAFIDFLKTIEWQFEETVQIYYAPATLENYELFRYVKLFERG